MYEHFTDRARKVMQLAEEEARRLGHEYLGTEHVLLGLVKEGEGVGSNVLKNFNVDLPTARKQVEKFVQPGKRQSDPQPLAITPRIKPFIEFATEELAPQDLILRLPVELRATKNQSGLCVAEDQVAGLIVGREGPAIEQSGACPARAIQGQTRILEYQASH